MPEITLISHDGFVKQVCVPEDVFRRGHYRIPSMEHPFRFTDYTDDRDVFDRTRQVRYTIREFWREGHTSVFQER